MLLPPQIFPARSLWIRPLKGALICHTFLESRPLSSGLFEVSELPPSIFKSNQRPVGGTKFHPRVGGIHQRATQTRWQLLTLPRSLHILTVVRPCILHSWTLWKIFMMLWQSLLHWDQLLSIIQDSPELTRGSQPPSVILRSKAFWKQLDWGFSFLIDPFRDCTEDSHQNPVVLISCLRLSASRTTRTSVSCSNDWVSGILF